ncbi:MAG: TraR/DksA family transcriptional regulator [Candidatus Latescibacterota bacterium]|nr:TraR/DksA family transcriptional regulator [Candidatus Latescibacterota bacterium]
MSKRVAIAKRDRDKIKKQLLKRRSELLADLDGNEADIDDLHDPKADDLDRAVEAGAMELLVALGDTERRELEEITLALEKLEMEDYGRCEACLETPLKLCDSCPFIPKTRLEALPTARLCVACQEAREQNRIPNYTQLRPRRAIFQEEGEFSHPLMENDND